MKNALAVVIMAAGKGTRMNNPNLAKVMYTVAGRPMLDYVIELAVELGSTRTIVVLGWQRESVEKHVRGAHPDVLCVEQSPQLGTGHAVMQSEQALADFSGDLLVLSGDVPLLSLETAADLLAYHRSHDGVATILTAILPHPAGYGRIVRDQEWHVTGIVEHKDATEEQRAIREINSGIYVFRTQALFTALREITPANAQHEYYLTDVFGWFARNNMQFDAVHTDDPREILGVNTPAQLEEVRAAIGRKK